MSRKTKKPERRYSPIIWDNVEDLGKVPDAVIAKRLHVSPQAVHSARQCRGIAASTHVGSRRFTAKDKKKARKKRRKKYRLMAEENSWNWTLTDREMAKTYKVEGKSKGAMFFNRIRILLRIEPATVLREDKS